MGEGWRGDATGTLSLFLSLSFLFFAELLKGRRWANQQGSHISLLCTPVSHAAFILSVFSPPLSSVFLSSLTRPHQLVVFFFFFFVPPSFSPSLCSRSPWWLSFSPTSDQNPNQTWHHLSLSLSLSLCHTHAHSGFVAMLEVWWE